MEQAVTEAIASAQSRVDVAVQALRLPRVTRALIERHQAGVQVRVIVDDTYSRAWSSLTASETAQLDERSRERYQRGRAFIDRDGNGRLSSAEVASRDAIAMLHQAGVPILDDTADGSAGSGLMHHKFAVIDGETTLVTSANLTLSGVHGDWDAPQTRGNANHLLAIQSPALAARFEREFELMWGDGPGGQPDSQFGLQKPARSPATVEVGEARVSVRFSPTSPSDPWANSSNGFIRRWLAAATHSADLALFVFSAQRLANTLAERHQQGVRVRALIDRGFAFRPYSEGLDMLGVALATDCSYEASNRPWSDPIETVGVPRLPAGDKLHHKFATLDGRTVLTGSHNWSAAANASNDETVIAIESPTVTAHFQRAFERLWSQAALGVPARVGDRIQAQRQRWDRLETPASPAASGAPVNLNAPPQPSWPRYPASARCWPSRSSPPAKSVPSTRWPIWSGSQGSARQRPASWRGR